MTVDSSFVHLHLHSNYSLQRGCASLDALIGQAQRLGMDTLALTDINNLYAAVPFFEKCREADIRPLIGVELTKGNASIVLLARNAAGYRFLCRAVSARHCNPELELPAILSSRVPEGICVIVFSRFILDQLSPLMPTKYLYAGIRPQETTSIAHRRFIDYAQTNGVKPVAMADVCMLDSGQIALYALLTAIREQTVIDNVEVPRSLKDRHMFSAEEAARIFADIPEALSNTRTVAAQCTFAFDFSHVIFPDCRVPPDETPFSYLYRICQTNLSNYYHPVTPAAVSRLAHELDVIETSGFSEYFLIVREIMQYARDNSIPVCVRGSGASSLITYVLGISDVDPIAYGLQFERFLNASRTDCPDLDIDICWRHRDELIEHVYQKYGHERTAMISTHNTYHARSAFRDAALSCGVSIDRINFLSKRIGRVELPSADEVLCMLPRNLSVPGDHELFTRILTFSRAMDGFPHHLSIHCGGIVIAPSEIMDHVPLEPASKGPLITQFEMRAIEKIGLVKMDLLGQRGLSTINESIQLVGEQRGEYITARDIPDQDPLTTAVLNEGRTIGCFQIESPGMRSLMQMLQTGNIKLLTAALALIRPGPARSGMKEAFVRRCRGLEANDSPLRCLQETYGIMLYQEDIMRAAHEAAGLSLGLGERLRKTLSKMLSPEKAAEIRTYFIERAMHRGLTSAQAQQVWGNMLQFASYSFCKAHAAVYGAYAYRAAYMKVHYPAEYLTAVMNNHTGVYPRSAYIEEARRLGVSLLPPDVNMSDIEYTCENGALRVGLGALSGLSSSVMRRILDEREERPFNSALDFFRRTGPPIPEAESLILSGALDAWGICRPVLIWLCRNLDAQPDLPFPDEFYPELPDYAPQEKLRYEYETLGFLCSGHPLHYLRRVAGFPESIRLAEVRAHTGRRVQAAGIGLLARSTHTSRGDIMGFMTIEDETATAEVTIPPKRYSTYRPIIYARGPFLVTGKVEDRYGSINILAEEIESLADNPY